MAAPEPTLREATREDLPTILALLADDDLGRLRETGPIEAVAAAFDQIARDPNNAIWLVEREGQVIGCAQLTFLPGLGRGGMLRAQIESVRIASPLRGAGLGGWFIEALVAKSKAAGCGLVQLTSDKRRTDAHRFYDKLGFTMSHEGFKLALG